MPQSGDILPFGKNPSILSPPSDPGMPYGMHSNGSSQLPPRTNSIRELQGVEPLPVDEFPWMEVSIGIGVAALLALVIYYFRRRRRPRPVESFEARARRRIADLAGLESPGVRAFHSEIADILTEYMDASLSLRASRLTSGEIVRAFRCNGHMSEEWDARLELLLARCDRAKFAPVCESDWDSRALLEECRRILDMLAVAVAAAPRLASPWQRWEAANGNTRSWCRYLKASIGGRT